MIGVINGLLTLLLIILFLSICAWAWSKSNKDKFDKMANLPLEHDVDDLNQNGEENDAK